MGAVATKVTGSSSIVHDDTIGASTSEYHRNLSNATYTRDGNGFITQIAYANGKTDVFVRDGNNFVTQIIGTVWTRTFTRDGNNFITNTVWTLT